MDSSVKLMERLLGPGFGVEEVTPCGVTAFLVRAVRRRDMKEMMFVYVMIGENRGLHKVDGDVEETLKELGVIKGAQPRLGGVSKG